ncbi:transporter substrate-binding domain-containing protein [Aequorivita sp. H23M31]|uniref:Transporter substrate-binding domain-containing protein n=1 Tax=Aequorivita ciconiae TaxID=2494375 RepID=A0A410G5P5_9FLAO|nr:transporter substrate-binding domain-containing protein [Aequorivita sp. H23M31]QAA82624.1 transporter substrate-binding domain-containing protein [Aequorivita sp. H23M31]
MRIIFLLFSFFLLTSLNSFAQNESAPKDSVFGGNEKLKVGYAGSEPFVMHGEKEEGIVIDIWKEIAFGLNRNYNFIEYKSVADGIKAIDKKELDILIGPITINSSRAALANFSQPFYNTELAILAPVVETTFWDKIKPFLSTTFIYAVLGLLVILSIVGFLFWVIEGRKYPEDYGEGVVKGTASGVWLAVVTMTTVGYGDVAPRTTGGRFLLGSWMIISLILATSFVAGIATTFSQTSSDDKTITNLSKLEDKKVAVPNYKKIIDKVRDVQGTPIPVGDVSEGYQMLMDKKVDALIYDEIPLQYVFADDKKDDFVLSKKRIEPQYYGFLFPVGSKLKRQVDLQIIRLQETQEITHIVEDWINRN